MAVKTNNTHSEKPRVRERKGARKFRTGNEKRKWLMRMRQIKILHIFVPNLRFDNNIAFSAKLRPI